MTSRRNSARRAWTDLEIDVLCREFADSRTDALAVLLGRTYRAVASEAKKLGLKKSAAFLASPAAGRLNGSTGLMRRFLPGQTPWNKGKTFATRGRSAQTQFKPGLAPKNTLPLGSYRISPDGYLEQKISELPGPPNLRWKSVHRLVWESAHGPVEPGHVVVFRPGRRSTRLDDITPDALETVTRAQLMARNTVHNLPPELAQLVQLRGVLARKINQRSEP